MKKILLLLLAISLLVCTGCVQEEILFRDPVKLYYRCSVSADGIGDQVIGYLLAEGDGKRDDPVALLNEYLARSPGDDLAQTFPRASRALSLTVTGSHASITLNDTFAENEGPALTIACACMAMTVMELTGTHSVTIKAENTTLGGSDQITIREDDLIFEDLYPSETT